MKTIRVAMMSMRPRLRDILTDALDREPDLDVIDWNAATDVDLATIRPDVLVCESAHPLDPGPPRRLLDAVPGGRVLVVAESGELATLFELRVAQSIIKTVGLDQIVSAIRFGLSGVQSEFVGGAGIEAGH